MNRDSLTKHWYRNANQHRTYRADCQGGRTRPRIAAGYSFRITCEGTQSGRSDIDLIVVRETNERFVERPTEILMMLYEKLRGWAIDVLVYTPEEYERMLRTVIFS